jgi:hypothetical protein
LNAWKPERPALAQPSASREPFTRLPASREPFTEPSASPEPFTRLSASIVVPTRARPDYLAVALASIAPQASVAGAEVIVVDDAGASEAIRLLARRYGARYEPHQRPLGLNVARNTGVERSSGELVVFVDDDVEVCEGWLMALLAAARAHPDAELMTGPIRAHLEGRPPRGCGRESPPITSLDLGSRDTWTDHAWGANMAIRRRALERIGPFDVSIEHGGDEQEWQERLAADRARRGVRTAGAPQCPRNACALYVADAALLHRRSPADARIAALCRLSLARGRAARRFDARRGEAPSLARELLTLAGCMGHVLRRSCPAGLTMVAHSAGRVEQALRTGVHASSPGSPNGGGPDDFLSGESGAVGGLDGARRGLLDLCTDALEVASGRRLRLERAARRDPSARRVLVLCVERPAYRPVVARTRAEIARSRHEVELCLAPPGNRGKFENLNLLLEEHPPQSRDWLLVVDDDVVLPHRFLDRFLFLVERFGFDLAQPAHRHASHGAWRVTRRRPRSVARETHFVEIGPVTAFARSTFSTLLPFPNLRMGWGLDLHWAALARERGWRCGVIDAVPVNHNAAPAASAYSREQALAEARAFLEHRPYLSASEAQRTIATHRHW